MSDVFFMDMMSVLVWFGLVLPCGGGVGSRRRLEMG